MNNEEGIIPALGFGVQDTPKREEEGHSCPSKGRGILAYFVKDRFL